jgi:hypothetical protein
MGSMLVNVRALRRKFVDIGNPVAQLGTNVTCGGWLGYVLYEETLLGWG